jgi:P-type conjugative transfer protein TrbJ
MTRRKKLILVALAGIAFFPVSTRAAELVFDPANFVEAILQVADDVRLVEQFKMEVQNELAMLKSWNFSDLPGILQSMGVWHQVFGQAGATYSSSNPGPAINNQYPDDPSSYASMTDSQYQSMQSGWDQEERSVLVENRTVQNQTYLNLQPTAQRIQDDVNQSNSASGATAAVQAGNEEIGTLVAQLQALQAQEITDARAEVERKAQQQAEEAYAQAQRQAVRGDWDSPQQPSETLINAFPLAGQ